MEQYINKSALVAKIEKRIKELQDLFKENEKKLDSFQKTAILLCIDECKVVLDILDSLEVKEEILDKEGKTNLMQKCVREAYKRGYDMGVLQTTNKINHNMKEVDLEKEIDKIWNPRFNLGWDEKSLLSMNHKGFTTIAKHFFELGLKAQKGE